MDEATARIARDQARKYYGKFRGFVVDNEDPEQLGRLRLTVPSVLGTAETGWALPCAPYGGLDGQGAFLVPDVGAQVWVEFEEGNRDQPIWVGTFWRTGDAPPADAKLAPPTTRILQTASGHKLRFDDKEGEEGIRVTHANAKSELLMEHDGNVVLTDEAGSKLTLDAAAGKAVLADANGNTLTMAAAGTTIEDANGNKVEMGASGITVSAAAQVVIEGASVAVGGQGGEPLIKGTSFLSLFMTHMHTCTAPGSPTSPPIPQGEMSTLTTKTTAA
jgi:uncharacterized protein involved in type VI secretion and phage assembly